MKRRPIYRRESERCKYTVMLPDGSKVACPRLRKIGDYCRPHHKPQPPPPRKAVTYE